MKSIVNIFLKGLVFALPLVITFGLVYWLFTKAENLFKIPLQWVLPEGAYITGMGVISALLVVFLLGLLVQAYVLKHFFTFLQSMVGRIPLIKTLYSTAQDFMALFAGGKEKTMQSVVSITLDSNIHLIGFVTNDCVDLGDDKGLVAVYFPMSYQVGGYTLLLPRERCKPVDMPAKFAMQQVLTAHVTKKS
ncbi:MAG: DUF502 domain-containing protein [Marinagarivorans sp.]|nr:DUF502 domain-containing protein [Marinagarivorans sp.]